MPKIVPQIQPPLDDAVEVHFSLPAPASPKMCSLKMQKLKKRVQKLKKRMNDPKAFVGCHAQKTRLFKTWPLKSRKKNPLSRTMRKLQQKKK